MPVKDKEATRIPILVVFSFSRRKNHASGSIRENKGETKMKTLLHYRYILIVLPDYFPAKGASR